MSLRFMSDCLEKSISQSEKQTTWTINSFIILMECSYSPTICHDNFGVKISKSKILYNYDSWGRKEGRTNYALKTA